ncbi:heptahelical protein 4 [Actinidia rufa]|uniref:Heptahelical protein 4 n=1 Tax=Actinidia rufa TaxID=165716 RepID=A0A7J0EJ57_9ERIC|nr:heptahelical protein 4 [Actinidia rufa]
MPSWGGGHVLPTSQHHLPPPRLPLRMPPLRAPPDRLRRHRHPNRHLLLPRSLLLLLVLPRLLPALSGVHHCIQHLHDTLLPPPGIPEAPPPVLPRLALLRDGDFGGGAHHTQDGVVWEPQGGYGNYFSPIVSCAGGGWGLHTLQCWIGLP